MDLLLTLRVLSYWLLSLKFIATENKSTKRAIRKDNKSKIGANFFEEERPAWFNFFTWLTDPFNLGVRRVNFCIYPKEI